MPTITPGARPLEFIRTLDMVDGVQRREVWTFKANKFYGGRLCARLMYQRSEVKRGRAWWIDDGHVKIRGMKTIPIPPDIRAALTDALVQMAREAVGKMPNPVQEKRVIALARRYGFKDSSNG